MGNWESVHKSTMLCVTTRRETATSATLANLHRRSRSQLAWRRGSRPYWTTLNKPGGQLDVTYRRDVLLGRSLLSAICLSHAEKFTGDCSSSVSSVRVETSIEIYCLSAEKCYALIQYT